MTGLVEGERKVEGRRIFVWEIESSNLAISGVHLALTVLDCGEIVFWVLLGARNLWEYVGFLILQVFPVSWYRM